MAIDLGEVESKTEEEKCDGPIVGHPAENVAGIRSESCLGHATAERTANASV